MRCYICGTYLILAEVEGKKRSLCQIGHNWGKPRWVSPKRGEKKHDETYRQDNAKPEADK